MTFRAKRHFLDEEAWKCSQQDRGPVHLLYGGEAVQDIRLALNTQPLEAWPNAVRVSGLFPSLEGVEQLRGTRAAIPHQARLFDEPAHLLVDGCTFFGTYIDFAVAAWAVVLAEEDSLEMTNSSSDSSENRDCGTMRNIPGSRRSPKC